MATLPGGVAAVLGVQVLAGWYLRSPALIQVAPAFVPMQYNTALGFLLSGIALVVAGDRGIAARDLGRIFFQLFQRGGNTNGGEVQVAGEGMGLAYVQTLVRRLGGRVWCTSKVGRGSTFHFTIPATPAHPAAPTEAEAGRGG